MQIAEMPLPIIRELEEGGRLMEAKARMEHVRVLQISEQDDVVHEHK